MGIPATFSFPGIAQVMAGTVNFGHGITPTGFQLTIVPQPSNQIIEIGDLTLEYNNQTLVFKDCRADQAAYSFDANGNVIALTILDRRWRWQFGRVSGEYNVRREDNTIEKINGGDPALAIENSERSPQQLARLLMFAAGEVIAVDAVNALIDAPNIALPYVNWDLANPMSELANLCDIFGCRVALCLDNLVRIFKVNVGKSLPSDGLIRYGASVDYISGPDRIAVVTAPIRFEIDFPLKAVGLDVDGEWKPIDDLSYTPDVGWNESDIFTDYQFVANDGAKSLAGKTVFRCYQIDVSPSRPLEVPGYGFSGKDTITRRSQIQLLGSLLSKEVDSAGQFVASDPIVYGVWYTENDFDSGNSATVFKWLTNRLFAEMAADDVLREMIVTVSYTIDSDRHMVVFSEPVYRVNGNGLWSPAHLALRTTCHIRNKVTRGIERLYRYRDIRNVANPTVMHLQRDDITPHFWAIYDGDNGPDYNGDFEPTDNQGNTRVHVGVVSSNQWQVDAEADYYLNEAFNRLTAVTIPQDGLYAGWVFNVDLDGAIQSITWSLSAGGNEGPTTRIERAQDTGGMSGIPYKLRRQYQKQAEAERKSALAEFKTRETRELAKVEGLY